MIGEVYNCRNIIPFAEAIDMVVPVNSTESFRDANTSTIFTGGQTVFTLGWVPIHPLWLEVYIDGFRVVNRTFDFDHTYQRYSVNHNVVTFTAPVTGTVTFVCDRNICPGFDPSQVVDIENAQGALVLQELPQNVTYASLYCEPVVLMQPSNGWVRMTDDRMSLLYVPNKNFIGYDSFSYTIITTRGQVAVPKCVNVAVGDVPEPEPEDG